ncbi:MAG TPA: helix-turn-helix domain-containing protein [Steroidobacteraceae bacterium]|nr:helix-turn-helix domain-containing protein [Steroidobacteraceae bacterium]
MTVCETFSADDPQPARRLEYWNDLASRTFTPVESRPADPESFTAQLSRVQIAGLCVAQVASSPAVIQHTRRHVDLARKSGYFLLLQLEGSSINCQSERAARLLPGDFTLCTGDRPFEMTLPAAGRRLVVGIPEGLLRRHLACPDPVIGVRMPGGRGMNALLGNFARSFWSCRCEAAEPAIATRMSYTLLDLIAAAYSATPHLRCDHSTLVAAHRTRILSYIEAHLRDPDLNPERVAQACRITARYLHHLFRTESETVTQYIQRRRLEECARALIEAPVHGRLVTEIAFDHGFNSLTHFGRVFRNQYGLTPSQYRRAARQ